jgi:hypothetical protein
MPSLTVIDERFPVTRAVLEAANPDDNRAFELGLELLLDGLERLPRAG